MWKSRGGIFLSIKIDVNWILANQSKDKHSNWKSIDEMLPVLASGKLTHEYSVCFDASLWCHILPLVFEFQFVVFFYVARHSFSLLLSSSEYRSYFFFLTSLYEMTFSKRSMVYFASVRHNLDLQLVSCFHAYRNVRMFHWKWFNIEHI